MSYKVIELTDSQLSAFAGMGSSMGSQATLCVQGSYPHELKDSGINPRGTLYNQLLGYTLTLPSGSQLAIETSFFDKRENADNNDLHIVNFESKTLENYYRGWGTWADFYGDNHKQHKYYLRNIPQ